MFRESSKFHRDSFVDDDDSIGGSNVDEMLDGEQAPPKTKTVVTRETRNVQMWRIAVILMLLIAGASTSALTYVLLHGEEEEDFETSYYLFVDTIRDASRAHIADVNLAFEGLSDTITGAAISSNTTFPFVTVPMFEIQGEHTRRASGIEVLSFSPIVLEDQREAWEQYARDHQGWLAESRDVSLSGDELFQRTNYLETDITPIIYEISLEPPFNVIPSPEGPFFPIWQTSPPPFDPTFVNYNVNAELLVKYSFPLVEATRSSMFTLMVDLSRLGSTAVNPDDHDFFHSQFVDNLGNTTGYSHPHSMIIVPVFTELNNKESPIVGAIFGVVPWDQYFINLLPEGVSGVFCILKNTCGQSYSYELVGNKARYLGEGDLHESDWDHMKVEVDLHGPDALKIDGNCLYSFDIYPSDTLHSNWDSKLPFVFASVVAATFVAMAITFFMYDGFVRRRNTKVVTAAARTDKIVSSLFPSNVRDRLLAEEEAFEQRQEERGARTRLKDFLANDGPTHMDMEETDDAMYKTKPIADLFPETSIMFADIAGFTAWSSTRDPSQVFMLLETVYRAFDEIAKRRRVFKVETVGDCYVAAAGLPDRRKDHAVALARFGRDCMMKMHSLTRQLETTLGPDTAELSLRMGIHSGPVTAGVLRGERSRFQLFGDTMNTASRMESTGIREKIQVSQETADLLYAAGKGKWIVPREDVVVAKGKGVLKTFWLLYSSAKNETNETGSSNIDQSEEDLSGYSNGSEASEGMIEQEAVPKYAETSAKTSRLINWNTEMLARLLKAIVARRQALNVRKPTVKLDEDFSRSNGVTVLEEVQEVVALPAFDSATVKKEVDSDLIELDDDVVAELKQFVASIASMYRENPFHNFDHASHVTLSVSKLMGRIVAPSDLDFRDGATRSQMLHDHTYGITSDPLTQFACILSGLIHDVDHTGVPNTQLGRENKALSKYYKGRSVAEQNSVDVAWDLLMDETFSNLRRTIYQTDDELKRFRQLVVNSVMATDIMDKELKTLRNNRWSKAFSEEADAESNTMTVQRKGTIVIEHLIQASDVAHTMQHWHIYRKWNQNLFREMHQAYVDGRSDKNPADFWYEGEIGFFDFYIIPLAKKLKECGVFGVCSDEYLNYAMKNRAEWEAKGRQVVAELVESVQDMRAS